jgi:hypothetical protein
MVVAMIALVDANAPHFDAGELLHLGDDRAEGVSIVGIAMQRVRFSAVLALALPTHLSGPRERDREDFL